MGREGSEERKEGRERREERKEGGEGESISPNVFTIRLLKLDKQSNQNISWYMVV